MNINRDTAKEMTKRADELLDELADHADRLGLNELCDGVEFVALAVWAADQAEACLYREHPAAARVMESLSERAFEVLRPLNYERKKR